MPPPSVRMLEGPQSRMSLAHCFANMVLTKGPTPIACGCQQGSTRRHPSCDLRSLFGSNYKLAKVVRRPPLLDS
jgi:hypothetical protein